MCYRYYIVLLKDGKVPLQQSTRVDKEKYDSNSIAKCEIDFLMYSDSEMIFTKKSFWKGKNYCIIDSEPDFQSNESSMRGDNMSITLKMYETIAKGNILKYEDHSYEFTIKEGSYVGFQHLTFSTGLQVVVYEKAQKDKEYEEEIVLEFIKKAYSLSEPIAIKDFNNQLFLNEWLKLNNN